MSDRYTNFVYTGQQNMCTDACQIAFHTGSFSDLSLFVGTGDERHTFKVHQIIVCSASSVIRNLLAAEDSNNECSILLPASKPHVIQNILDYIYLGSVNIISSDIRDFIYEAKALDIKGIPKEVVDDQKKTRVMRQYTEDDLRAAVTMTQLRTIGQNHVDPYNKSATSHFPVHSPLIQNTLDIEYPAIAKPSAAVPSSRKCKAAAVRSNSATPPSFPSRNTMSTSLATSEYDNEMESDESDSELQIDETAEEKPVPMDYCEESMVCNEHQDLRVFPTTNKMNFIPDLISLTTASNTIKSEVPYTTSLSRSVLNTPFRHNNLHNINSTVPIPSTSKQMPPIILNPEDAAKGLGSISSGELYNHMIKNMGAVQVPQDDYQSKEKVVKSKSKAVKGGVKEKRYTAEILAKGVLLAINKVHPPTKIITDFSIPRRTFFRHLLKKRVELGLIDPITGKPFDKSNSDPSSPSNSTTPSEYMDLNPKETESLRQLPNKLTDESSISDNAPLEELISRLQSALKKEPICSFGSQSGVGEFSIKQKTGASTQSVVGKMGKKIECKSSANTGKHLHLGTTGNIKCVPSGSKPAVVSSISPKTISLPIETIIRLCNSRGPSTPSIVTTGEVSSNLKVDVHSMKNVVHRS